MKTVKTEESHSKSGKHAYKNFPRLFLPLPVNQTLCFPRDNGLDNTLSIPMGFIKGHATASIINAILQQCCPVARIAQDEHFNVAVCFEDETLEFPSQTA